MGSVHWAKVEEIFREAVKLGPKEQEAYLKMACAADHALDAEVRELLSADAEGGGPLSGVALDALVTSDLLMESSRNPIPAGVPAKKSSEGTSQNCHKGHLYDPLKHISCPYCGVAGLELDLAGASSWNAPHNGMLPPVVVASAPGGGIAEDPTLGLSEVKMRPEPVVGWLVCVAGPDCGQDYRIRSQKNLIGRDAGMDISIPGDGHISRRAHASLTYDPRSNTFRLAPGEARRRIYLNDEPVEIPMTLRAYDRIEIGKTSLIFVPLCGKAFQWQQTLSSKRNAAVWCRGTNETVGTVPCPSVQHG